MDKRTGLGVGGMLRRIGLTGLCFSRDRSFVVSNEELLRWLHCMQRWDLGGLSWTWNSSAQHILQARIAWWLAECTASQGRS